ncbi:glycosyltransferase 25 family member [Orussus abietinus]|uniref:glycosyltransferase 25 family member n=1 Tax=Orussus abietinus TaxID=222816 RepID=UPI00062682D6|nr:glycosyltransferase 25 family member [Orussus abietinus]
MQISARLVFLLITCFLSAASCTRAVKQPTVLVAVLARNKAHTLPYFLTLLQQLDYPKDRVSLWIRSDNNVDATAEILRIWLDEKGRNYHSVDVEIDNESNGIQGEKGIADWPLERFNHVINLREEALNYGRRIWADYVFMLDADAFPTNPKSLQLLTGKNQTIVAPLLKSDGMYSNFWAGMTSDYYYLRTNRYKPILNRDETGCFDVPMVHTAVLIDLRKAESDLLTYQSENLEDYDGPKDDIITFAVGANKSGIPLHVCNDEVYGYVMVPLENQGTIGHDLQQLTNLKLEILAQGEPLPLSQIMSPFVRYPERDKLGMDEVYMINLERRPERRVRMERCFKELGIDAKLVKAVDGRTIDTKMFDNWGMSMMPTYLDPYHKRPMTNGEVGCFLSHFLIWEEVVSNNYTRVMILEDDIRFEPYFRRKVNFIISELTRLDLDWDLVYLGRKRMQEQEEPMVEGSEFLVHAGYSYWTLGYMLSLKGAQKLIEAKPCENMLPVDELLPILFDKHPRTEWKEYFPNRDLVAFSASPLLVYPTHYTGESGYISDTEDSNVVSKLENQKNKKVEL